MEQHKLFGPSEAYLKIHRVPVLEAVSLELIAELNLSG